MAKMEGAELTPDARIYNAIIYAFSRGGDTVAAEFYFWEMKRKGMLVLVNCDVVPWFRCNLYSAEMEMRWK